MKTILVDAINGYVRKDGTIFKEMHDLLESYPNTKIVLTGANDEQIQEFNLDKIEYTLFTLKHNPEKSNPEYYKILLNKYGLRPEDVIYFEHNEEAADSAKSVGIKTLFYDYHKEDLDELKYFLENNIN